MWAKAWKVVVWFGADFLSYHHDNWLFKTVVGYSISLSSRDDGAQAIPAELKSSYSHITRTRNKYITVYVTVVLGFCCSKIWIIQLSISEFNIFAGK